MNRLSFFKINDSFLSAKISLISTIAIGIVSYNLYFIFGYTNPDGIVEGLTSFSNATWIISGCGRWLLAIILALSGNVVMPLFSVVGYAINAWLASFVICKLFNIKSTFLIVIISAIMNVCPAVITQFTLNAIAFPYSISMLLATLYVYINYRYHNPHSYIISSLCFTASLGIFQNYAGFAACLILMVMIIMLIRETDIKEVFWFALKSLLIALVGFVLYFIVLKVILFVFNLSASSRMSELSIGGIVGNLFKGLFDSYSFYYKTMNDNVFFRNIMYLLYVLVIFITVIFSFNKKRITYLIISVILTALIPLASNIICLVLPDEGISVPMTHQNMLIVPFAFALVNSSSNGMFKKLIEILLCTVTSLMMFTYIVSANATFSCYRLTYRYTYGQMSQIVYDIQHNDDYILNETPVITVGYFEDTALRKNIKTYRYAIDLPENLVFWKVPVGVTYNRQKYFMNYFGLDFKDIDYSEYQDIISSSEFKQMDNWPSETSIKKIGKFLVVKIADNYIK